MEAENALAAELSGAVSEHEGDQVGGGFGQGNGLVEDNADDVF